jgi:hypothetical protein
MKSKRDYPDGAAELVAIVQAARTSGNRTLERSARRELSRRHGVKLSFRRKEATPCQQ